MSHGSALALAISAAGLSAVAHLLMKAGAARSHGKDAVRWWLNPMALAGYGIMFGVTLLNLAAFKVLPIKFGVVLQPLVLLLVVVGARAFFHEPIRRPTLVGLGLIVAGVVVFNWPGTLL